MPNNILVCGLGKGSITKWNLNNFTKIDSFKPHNKNNSSDLKHVSSSQIAIFSWIKEIKLWDIETNECVRTFIGHTSFVNCLEISFDRSKLYSGSSDGILRAWDISSGECLKSIYLGYPINCLKLIASNFIAVGFSMLIEGTTENLNIIDLKSYKIVKSLVQCEIFCLKSLNFDSEKNILFIGNEFTGELQMWQF